MSNIALGLTLKGKFKVSHAILDSYIADIDHDGQLEYIIGTHNDFIRVFKWKNGAWTEISNLKLPMSITAMNVGDIDNDEVAEVVIGTRDKILRLYKYIHNQFVEIATQKLLDPINDIAIGDAFNKNLPQIVFSAGKFLYFYSYVRNQLKEDDNLRQPRDISKLYVGDVDNDKANDILFGGRWNEIQLIQYKSRFFQQMKAKLHIDYYVKAITAADINNDGIKELLFSTANGKFGIYTYSSGTFLPIFSKSYKGTINNFSISNAYMPQKSVICIGSTSKELILLEIVDGQTIEAPPIQVDSPINTLNFTSISGSKQTDLLVGCESGEILHFNLSEAQTKKKKK